MTANVITYRSRSAAREVGKALSLREDEIDRLAKVMNNFEFTDPNETLGRNPRRGRDVVRHAAREDVCRPVAADPGPAPPSWPAFRRHGDLQGELDSVVPLEPATMPGRVVIQWDKDDCADMGIVKVDLLGLGMMAVLQDAIEMVNVPIVNSESRMANSRFTNPRFTIRPQPTFRRTTPRVYELLQQADTIGVFQVESRAQMATLPRMKPTRFYDLVVEVAIIRPGPIVGNMVHPYLNRRSGKEPIEPLHPCLEPVLARTLGVPLFQEQLLRMAMVAAGFTGGQAEELRRAMGFKRSEKRMKQIEVQLREGMTKNGITGATADRIIQSITSFALYGFPESHAASFALLAYASAYLKVYYPSAFYTALLNNQPMGFYHPASLVKDAQRRGVRFHAIDVQQSDWLCRVEEDSGIRIGFMYVNGLRKDVGQAMAAFDRTRSMAPPLLCPKCGCEDESMIEEVETGFGLRTSGDGQEAQRPDGSPQPVARTPEPGARNRRYYCNICSHDWSVQLQPAGRFDSIEQVVQKTGLRRDELTTLADIGALNAFTHERRSALWQVERAVRPAGEMFELAEEKSQIPNPESQIPTDSRFTIHDSRLERPPIPTESRITNHESRMAASPLPPMNDQDRLRADYGGTSLTIGPHPMALRREELALRGIVRASDLPRTRDGRRVRVAGMVITRQRPGTAKGFVFLTLEDETGISNVIIRPDLFDRERMTVVRQPFLMVDGVLQNQEGVLSVRAERLEAIDGGAAVDAHDFY
jgi:error-prone DNA polymerase